jgi:peptide/nickel transport system substrate-binding protein
VLMLVDYFREVGVNCAWKQEGRALYDQRWKSNLINAAWWGTGHETLLYLNWGNFYIGEYTDRPWAGGWGLWYGGGDANPAAHPPPDGHWLWDMWETWVRGEQAMTQEERVQVVGELMEIWKAQIPVVGVLGGLPRFCIVKNGLVNMVEGVYLSDRTADESICSTPVLFWDDPLAHS